MNDWATIIQIFVFIIPIWLVLVVPFSNETLIRFTVASLFTIRNPLEGKYVKEIWKAAILDREPNFKQFNSNDQSN